MKKNLTTMLMALLVVMFLSLGNKEAAYAATLVQGTTMETAQEVVFGEKYTLQWIEDEENLYYLKVNLTEQGILTINYTKPMDSFFKRYGSIHTCVYDEKGNVLYENRNGSTADDEADNFNIYVGLGKGTYYILTQSSFFINELDTSDCVVAFTPNAYCEVESNETKEKADLLTLDQDYTGYFGIDNGFSGTEKSDFDFWKIDLRKGFTYKFTLSGDVKEIMDTTIIMSIEDENEDYGANILHGERQLNGTYVLEYIPEVTKTYYVKIHNYAGKQLKYVLNVHMERKSLKECKVTLGKSSYYYNGKNIEASVVVKDGDVKLKKGVDYTVTYKNNKNIGKASVIIEGIGDYKETVTKTFNIKAKKGAEFTSGAYEYKVTDVSTVAFNGIKSNKTKVVNIPKTVKYGGKTFKVTSVASKALKGEAKVTQVKGGANVKTIGVSAFEGCKNLSKVTLSIAVVTIDDKAFKGCTELKSIIIPKNVKTIDKQAFYGCKNLKTITIKTTKLTTVGKQAFKNTNSKAVVRVPGSKLEDYTSLLKNKGFGKNVKIKK